MFVTMRMHKLRAANVSEDQTPPAPHRIYQALLLWSGVSYRTLGRELLHLPSSTLHADGDRKDNAGDGNGNNVDANGIYVKANAYMSEPSAADL